MERVKTSNIIPPHSVRYQDHLDVLVKSMKLNGWAGRDILAIRDGAGRLRALTGSHRIAAALKVGIDIPVQDWTDSFDLVAREVLTSTTWGGPMLAWNLEQEAPYALQDISEMIALAAQG